MKNNRRLLSVRLLERSELQPTVVGSIPLPVNGIPLRREKRNCQTMSWVIALGLVAFGVLANWYLVFVWSAETVTIKQVQNPYQSLYEDLLYPSVRITTDDGIGSGIIIHRGDAENAESIYILTAGHVVGNEALVKVELFGSTESLPAFVVATDTDKDLALLKLIPLNPQHLRFHTANLAVKDYVPYIFTPVWVIGCSLGLAPRPTVGEITATIGPDWEMNAPIWPGNSGGGVFLKDTHELIGIAVWVKICQGQLASTMGGIVTLQTIYEFLESTKAVKGDELYE